MQAGKPCSCCLALPCCHGPASLLSLPLPFSLLRRVCRARQGKTGQGVGSTGAHHWPKATGCRISRGWLPAHRGLWIGEAPGGVGSCRDDWKSLEAHCPAQGRTVSLARGAAFFLLYLPACAATTAPDIGADSWARVVKEGRACEGVREEMSGRASADVQHTL